MAGYIVHIDIDLIKIRDEGMFKSTLWCPFDKDTAFSSKQFMLSSLASIEEQVQHEIKESLPAIKARIAATGDKFNGFRCWAKLGKGQRKPNGWNKSTRLRIDTELKDETNSNSGK